MALFLTKPAILGDTQVSGQVIVLDVDGVQYGVPSKKLPWFKFNIRGVLPEDCGGNPNDVRWLTAAKLYVLAVFPDGTFDPTTFTPQEPSSSEDTYAVG